MKHRNLAQALALCLLLGAVGLQVQANPLHQAAAKGETARLKGLLKRHPGWPNTAKDRYGATPLNYALELGRPAVANALRQQGGRAGIPKMRMDSTPRLPYMLPNG